MPQPPYVPLGGREVANDEAEGQGHAQILLFAMTLLPRRSVIYERIGVQPIDLAGASN